MDIVARLKEEAVDYEWDGIDGSLSEWPLLIEAADEIDRLRAEVEALRNVLRDVSDDLAYMIDLDYTDRNTYLDSRRRYKRDMEPVETATAYDGLREGEREMLDRIRSKDAARQDYKQYRYERDNANHTGYSDRKRIRELEMRKRELHGDLKRAKSPSERWGIESQIIGIDRQIEQISAPRY